MELLATNKRLKEKIARTEDEMIRFDIQWARKMLPNSLHYLVERSDNFESDRGFVLCKINESRKALDCMSDSNLLKFDENLLSKLRIRNLRGEKQHEKTVVLSTKDQGLIKKIAERYYDLTNIPVGATILNLTACQLNGNPLELAELLAADEFSLRYMMLEVLIST